MKGQFSIKSLFLAGGAESSVAHRVQVHGIFSNACVTNWIISLS